MPRTRAFLSAALGLPLWLTIGAVVVDSTTALADTPVTPIERSKPGDPSVLRSFLKGSRSNRPDSLDTSWWGMAGITLALAVCGGIYAGCRRFLPQNAVAAMQVQVVGRVSLSPKHTVYLLRVGRRALLVGAGPQGAPSLITELDDFPAVEPNPPQQGAEP
jgi:flagellar protein FliO/FliZ